MKHVFTALFFLCRCLAPNHESGATDELRAAILSGRINWEAVVEIANQNLVIPALWSSLAAKGLTELLPDDVREYLRELHRLNTERNKSLKRQTREMILRLNSEGIEPILLKGGAHLFTDLFGDPGARMMSDIDILPPEELSQRSLDALQSIGYDMASEGEADPSFHHLPPLRRAGEPAPVELHTALSTQAEPQVVSAAAAWRHSSAVSVDGITFRLLSPVHTLVYCIFHSEVHHHGYTEAVIFVRQMCDFAFLYRHYGDQLEWSEIAATMGAHGLGNVLNAYTYKGHRVFGNCFPRKYDWSPSTRLHSWLCLAKLGLPGFEYYLFGPWREIRLLFASERLRERFGCSESFLDLAKCRTRYAIHLLTRYAFGSKRSMLWGLLSKRKHDGT